MDVIEGTDIGQANLASRPQKSASPNPLAKLVGDRMAPILTELDTISGAVFLDAFVHPGIEEDRPATDAECLSVHFAFRMDCDVDATQPIAPQLRKWLVTCAAQIDIVRIGIEGMEHGGPAVRKKAGAA